MEGNGFQKWFMNRVLEYVDDREKIIGWCAANCSLCDVFDSTFHIRMCTDCDKPVCEYCTDLVCDFCHARICHPCAVREDNTTFVFRDQETNKILNVVCIRCDWLLMDLLKNDAPIVRNGEETVDMRDQSWPHRLGVRGRRIDRPDYPLPAGPIKRGIVFGEWQDMEMETAHPTRPRHSPEDKADIH